MSTAANDRAGAAAFQPPSSAGVSSLDERRRAVAERLLAKQCAETIARLRDAAAVDHVAAALARSIRAHPSNPKPYDHEGET